MNDCLFCKIIKGEIPCSKVFEDDYVLAFEDLDKKAPFHVLLIPKIHLDNILEFSEENSIYFQKMLSAIKIIAKAQNIDESGFRCVVNTKEDGGQTINHLHMHILGKRSLSWPPG